MHSFPCSTISFHFVLFSIKLQFIENGWILCLCGGCNIHSIVDEWTKTATIQSTDEITKLGDTFLFTFWLAWAHTDSRKLKKKRKSLVCTPLRPMRDPIFDCFCLICAVGLEDEWWKIKNFPRVHKMFLQIICIKRSLEECKMIQSTWQNYGITAHISHAHSTQTHTFRETVRVKEISK